MTLGSGEFQVYVDVKEEGGRELAGHKTSEVSFVLKTFDSLDWHRDQYLISILIHTWLTLDQQLVNSQPNVGQFFCINQHLGRLLITCQLRCQSSVQQVSTEVSTEWQLSIDQVYWSWVSIKDINRPSTTYPFSTHYPKTDIRLLKLTDLEEIFINSDGILRIFQSLVIGSQHHKGRWAIPIISSYCRG